MSFLGMSSWQAWTLMAAVALAAVWVFRWQVRPPRVSVSSLLVWGRVLDRSREQSWWERVRRAVSLMLTGVIAVAIALALTRPGPGTSGAAPGRRLLVLDSSWSMRARTADGRTRWDHAVAEARALARSSGGDEVALATTAAGVVEGPTMDLPLIEAALERLTPGGGGQAAWPRVDAGTSTYFVTDGAVARTLDPSISVVSVFEPAPNVALTAFAARPAASSTSGAEAYLDVTNAARAQRVHLTVTRGTTAIVDRQIEMAAGDVVHQVVSLDAGGGARLHAQVSAPANALDVDDEAVAWLAMAEPVVVTLVSDAPEPFVRLLRNDPAVRVMVMRPAEYHAVETDVWIFDRWLPPEAPVRPMLVFAPPSSPWLARGIRDEVGPQWAQSRVHPVLEGVDPMPLEIIRARAYDAMALQPAATSTRGTPLISLVDLPRTRAVIVGFALAESNLTATPVFPVLVGNALDWLAHPATGESREPGPLELPASASRVIGPDGGTLPLARTGERVLVWLRSPGLYRIEAGGSRSVIGVNVGALETANLQRTSLAASTRSMSVLRALGGRPWWEYAVALALGLLALEWWAWQRRITV